VTAPSSFANMGHQHRASSLDELGRTVEVLSRDWSGQPNWTRPPMNATYRLRIFRETEGRPAAALPAAVEPSPEARPTPGKLYVPQPATRPSARAVILEDPMTRPPYAKRLASE